VIFRNRVIIFFLFLFLVISYMKVDSFVTRPVDEIPGVKYPTQNPAVPTITPRPKVNKEPTPVKIQEVPSAEKSPIFVPVENPSITGNYNPQDKKDSSTLKVVIFLFGVLIIGGGLIFLYRTRMKG